MIWRRLRGRGEATSAGRANPEFKRIESGAGQPGREALTCKDDSGTIFFVFEPDDARSK